MLRKGLVCLFLLTAGSSRGQSAPDSLDHLQECRVRQGLPNFFSKLGKGDVVTIAYLGGSITAAGGGWRDQSMTWFQQQFPKARISQVNAGVGGTGSDLGAFRCRRDVLTFKPDLVFVEFAVNDGGNIPRIEETMEGIVRQILRNDPRTDICFVYTVSGNMLDTLEAGHLWPSMLAMEHIATHYGIPSVQLGMEAVAMVKEGKLIFNGKPEDHPGKLVFTGDNVHPNTHTGHRLYTEALIRSMEKMRGNDKPLQHALRTSYTVNNWEDAQMVSLKELTLTGNWTDIHDGGDSLARKYGNKFPDLYKSNEPGASISFSFNGRLAGVYDLIGPGTGGYAITVDEQPEKQYPRFDRHATYYRAHAFFLPSMEKKDHRLVLRVSGEKPDKMKILQQGDGVIGDLKKYEENACYPGWILILGKLNKVRADTGSYDVCVYGATSAGVIAAYTAKMMGRSVVLIDQGRHIGGLSSGGLGFTDIGNKYVVTGLGLDFYKRVGKHYGQLESWIFEPHVARDVFQEYIREAKLETWMGQDLREVSKIKGMIAAITVADSSGQVQRVKAKVFIDCTYEGDLMAKAGVSYTIGRESNQVYQETYNGVQLLTKNQLPDSVDPYKTAGNPASGLLWGISPEKLAPNGTGDRKVQAYNFRVCLTNDPANRIEITQPRNYDPARYELLLRVVERKPGVHLNGIMKLDRMPNHKTDINNNGGFSTDMIGMNYAYPDADKITRKTIVQLHEDYVKGLLYFIGHDHRMPALLREEMLQFGYPRDEYPDNDHWSPQLYIREARRMVGAYVMTQANCQGRTVVEDGIGMAAYGMDSHNCQRVVVNGMVKDEGDVQVGGFGPYPVSYRSILPKPSECGNLLVPVGLSASHIAYGSIRMEPVFMVLSQAAAAAAVMSIDRGVALHALDVHALNRVLQEDPLANGSTPDIVVDNADASKVSFTGQWLLKENEGYGPDCYVAAAGDGAENTITFRPAIAASGDYSVYVYVAPSRQHAASRMEMDIFDGRETRRVVVSRAAVRVQGQTSGEWHRLGDFHFEKGKDNRVTISTRNADGEIVGDAVLFHKNN